MFTKTQKTRIVLSIFFFTIMTVCSGFGQIKISSSNGTVNTKSNGPVAYGTINGNGTIS